LIGSQDTETLDQAQDQDQGTQDQGTSRNPAWKNVRNLEEKYEIARWRKEVNIGEAKAFFLVQSFSGPLHFLINFDHTVDLPNKPKAGQESNCACEKEKAKDHDRGVTKVEEC